MLKRQCSKWGGSTYHGVGRGTAGTATGDAVENAVDSIKLTLTSHASEKAGLRLDVSMCPGPSF